jgi:hypothetical protein
VEWVMFFDDFILYIGMSKVEQSVVLITFYNSYIIKYNIRAILFYFNKSLWCLGKKIQQTIFYLHEHIYNKWLWHKLKQYRITDSVVFRAIIKYTWLH